MALDNEELREYGHGMLGNVAQELGAGFGPYLQPCVEAAIASCDQVASLLTRLLPQLPHICLLPREC